MMRMIALLLVGSAIPCVAAEPHDSASYEKLDPPASTPGPLLAVLAKDALVVRGDNDEPVMKIWFRDPIPVNATAEQVANGLTYREIPEGTLVGVIEFPRPFTDFRRQVILEGAYSLRFALQPDIGDHIGTAPHPDFCLMTKLASEKALDRIEKKDLIALSSEVNEGKHPAVLLLFPSTAKDLKPKVTKKPGDVRVVETARGVKIDDKSTTLGFAITIAGMWKP